MKDFRKYVVTAVINSKSIEDSTKVDLSVSYEDFVVGNASFDGTSFVVNPLDESISRSNPYRRIAYDAMMRYGIISIFNKAKVTPMFMEGKAVGIDENGILLNNAKNMIIERNLSYMQESSETSKVKTIVK